jgi:hypothetical protein
MPIHGLEVLRLCVRPRSKVGAHLLDIQSLMVQLHGSCLQIVYEYVYRFAEYVYKPTPPAERKHCTFSPASALYWLAVGKTSFTTHTTSAAVTLPSWLQSASHSARAIGSNSAISVVAISASSRWLLQSASPGSVTCCVGVAVTLGLGLAVRVAVTEGLGEVVPVGVAVGVVVRIGVVVGVGDGTSVLVPVGVRVAPTEAVGDAVGFGVAVGLGLGVPLGAAVVVSVGVVDSVPLPAIPPQKPPRRK